MNRRTLRPSALLLTLIGVLLSLSSMTARLVAQDQAPEHPFLWRIDGSTVPCYLFGTIHLPDPRVTTLHPAVDAAIEHCDALYTELPMDLKTTTTALRLSVMPRGKKLVDVLGAELHERLANFFEDRGVPFATIGRMKPWAIASQVTMIDHLKEMSAGAPLDMQLYKRAEGDDKEVGGLETVEEQVGVFDGLSDAEQATFVRESLDSYERSRNAKRDMYEELIGCYVSGSGDRLEELMDEQDSYGDKVLAAKIEQTLLIDRNHNMADRIARRMADAPDKSLFFAVGAAHAFGEHSVVKLLREKGLTVVRLPATPEQERDARIESALARRDALKRQAEELDRQIDELRKEAEVPAGAQAKKPLRKAG